MSSRFGISTETRFCYGQRRSTGKRSWDFRDGVYYEKGTPFDVITLTDDEFVCRSQGGRSVTVSLKRVSKADAQNY